MTAEHAHKDLVFGIQALRRRVERDAADLGGAVGVRAEIYPHQIGTAHRILTAPNIRHLLADEVGLGKTVQALMIINALRAQNPLVRALIVVPNELRSQWRDEIWTRAHRRPAEEALAPEADRRVRLAWPEVLKSDLRIIHPEEFELLVVDEFHDLQVAIQRRILEVAEEFRSLLLISATPPFQDPDRRRDVLQMIEPTRLALAEAHGLDGLADTLQREEAAARLLERDADTGEWERQGLRARPPGSKPESASTAAQSFSIYRRIVRTRRADYRAYMPAREHRTITVEPTDAEVERQRLMWRYFQRLPELTRVLNLELIAQRVIRSASSLRQRVTYLRGHGHEREGLLAEVDPLLDRSLGDSRFEALVDLLSEIWRLEPGCRVLVAGGDNLTVDVLAQQLPRALGRLDPSGADSLPVAAIRNQGQEIVGADSLADPNDAIEHAVEAFRSGEARLLIAAQLAKLGLNLQFARHLILYSIPWSPQEVEQWIGRLDRIGNQALKSRSGEAYAIQVHTIAQRGLVDERVRGVLAASSIFEESLSLDGARVKQLTEKIHAAGLGAVTDWRQLMEEARGVRGSLADLKSPLRAALPWGPDLSERLHRRVVTARPAPLGAGDAATPLEAREQALSGWVDALAAAEEYLVKPHRQGVRALSYTYVKTDRGRPLKSRGMLKEVFPDHRRAHHRYRVPFIERRADAQLPPRREVEVSGERRNLYFLNHGSPLHDDLVDSWLELGRSGVSAYDLTLPRGACRALAGDVVQIVVGVADPALESGRLGDFLMDAALGLGFERAVAERAVASIFTAQRVVALYEADQRFARAHLPSQLVLGGVRLNSGRPAALGRELIEELLSPDLFKAPRPPRAMFWRPPSAYREAAVGSEASLVAQITRSARQQWSADLPAYDRALASRRYQVGIDCAEECELLDNRLRGAEAAVEEARAALELGEGQLESAARKGMSKAELTKLRRALAPSKARLSRAGRDVETAQGRSIASMVAVDARSAWLRVMERRPRGEVVARYRSALIRVSHTR